MRRCIDDYDGVNKKEKIDRFLQTEAEFHGDTPYSLRHDQVARWGSEANLILDSLERVNEQEDGND